MATAEVTVMNLPDALGRGFDFSSWFEDTTATLTTEHAAASYGQAVVVYEGAVYGPGDLPGVTVHLSATNADTAALIGPARAAGWAVSVAAWCAWCGEPLSEPESRRPGDQHPTCATTSAAMQQSRV